MDGELRHVTDVRSPRRGSRRREIYLDGDLWRATTVGVLRDLGVAPGDDIDPDDLDGRARELEAEEARARALRLLGYRERSEHTLLSRLVEDGYPQDVAAAVVADLVQSGLVDNARYADLLARSLIEIRGLGRARAARELTAHGVPDALIAASLDAYAPAEQEADRALAAAHALARPSDTVERLAGRLVRRGFGSAPALTAARATLPQGEPPDPTV